MNESAATSANQNLLTARNAILVAVGVLALSFIWACAKMLRPIDSGGMARDSFGTRGDGFRALFEMLQELHIRVTRSVAPPTTALSARTLVLLAPNPQLVQFEPKYLTSLTSWIENGGRLVLAPLWVDKRDRDNDDQPGERDILKLLGLNGFVTLQREPASSDVRREQHNNSHRGDRSPPAEFWEAWNYTTPIPRVFVVDATGSLKVLGSEVRKVAAPGDEFSVLKVGTRKPSGALQLKSDNGGKALLVAVVPRGKGEIVVISEPALFCNMLLAKSDNSVLAARLLAPHEEPIVFDEYYHGLAVRGNPLFLLTRPGFAATAAGILLVIVAFAWRAAVFLGPPLADREKSRRNIQEYIDAMGAFFCRALDHRRFLMREVRDGVLHELCEQLHLPAHTSDIGVITSVLGRRDPKKADTLRQALADIDDRLAAAGEYPRANFLTSIQRLAGCL